MFFKVCILAAIVACSLAQHHGTSYASVSNHVVAGHYEHGTDAVGHGHQDKHYPHHHPKYEYKYGVEDLHTHDIKTQQEERDGDVLKGYYTLLQPDGRTRIVHYTANKHDGFNADVKYSGHADHPQYKH